jgi:hypothetical protein
MKIYFSNIVSILAVCISLLTIIYTRKNIKSQKYIDTVTKQRILWIDTLRNDFSCILAHVEKIRYCRKIEEIDINVGFEPENGSEVERFEYDEFIKLNQEEKKKLEIQNYEISTKIELSILGLNDNDDDYLIRILTKLKKIYQERNYGDVNDDLIITLRNEIKKILKAEWEKVKKETIKGGLINLNKN